jgi:hypothetical protein
MAEDKVIQDRDQPFAAKEHIPHRKGHYSHFQGKRG